MILFRKYFLFFGLLFLTACSSIPQNTADGCSIFSERYLWYKHAKKTEKKWGTPINLQLAIIKMESDFDWLATSLETEETSIFKELIKKAELMRKKLREEMQIEFTIENGQLHILDGIRVTRRPRAAVTIAVSLAKDKIITKEEALMRVDPRAVGELLHRQIDPNAERNILAKGVAASPGAATGMVVFSASAAQACAGRGEAYLSAS